MEENNAMECRVETETGWTVNTASQDTKFGNSFKGNSASGANLGGYGANLP